MVLEILFIYLWDFNTTVIVGFISNLGLSMGGSECDGVELIIRGSHLPRAIEKGVLTRW